MARESVVRHSPHPLAGVWCVHCLPTVLAAGPGDCHGVGHPGFNRTPRVVQEVSMVQDSLWLRRAGPSDPEHAALLRKRSLQRHGCSALGVFSAQAAAPEAPVSGVAASGAYPLFDAAGASPGRVPGRLCGVLAGLGQLRVPDLHRLQLHDVHQGRRQPCRIPDGHAGDGEICSDLAHHRLHLPRLALRPRRYQGGAAPSHRVLALGPSGRAFGGCHTGAWSALPYGTRALP